MTLYQELVFFDDFPTLDSDRLVKVLRSFEDSEDEAISVSDPVEGEELPEEAAPLAPAVPDLRTATAEILIGPFQIRMVVMGAPSPHADCLSAASFHPDEMKRMLGHKAHALLTLNSEEDEAPIERMIALLKAGFALCEQGAAGFGNEISLTAFPSFFLEELGNEVEEAGESLWELLRRDGVPVELLINLFVTETHRQHWCFSAGHELFDFPDFAYQIQNASEIDEVQEVFTDAFLYMFENGPIIEAGQRFGNEDTGYFQFDPPSATQDFLQQENGILVVRRLDEEEY